jgi:hypothetical protein
MPWAEYADDDVQTAAYRVWVRVRVRDRQIFDRSARTNGAPCPGTVHSDLFACRFSEWNDAGGHGRTVGQEWGRHRVAGVSKQGIERGLEAVTAEQGFPHHRGNLEAGTHRRARTAAHHIDAKLQAAQTLLVGLWKLAKKLFDQGKATRFEGGWIGFGQTRPFVKIKREAEISRCLHLSDPVTLTTK